MEEFEESFVKLANIDHIFDPSERTSIFNTIDQLFSSSAFFMLVFQGFDQFQTDTGKVSMLKNIEYWINNNWEQINADGILDELRTFLFETLPPIQMSQSKRVCDAISMAQARFCQRILPQWGDFFTQTFFDDSHFPIAISFILAMCKMLSTPLYNERTEIITFRNALIEDGKSEFFQQLIFQGIGQSIPNAFLALGYFSICFDNTWISNEELFQAFGSGMENALTSTSTLEAINLLLQSNFEDDVKTSIITTLNIIDVIAAGSEDAAIVAKYAEIIYTLIQIFSLEDEIYGTLVDIAISFLPLSDMASIYGCLALTSALNKNVSDKSEPIITQCLIKLREINTNCSSYQPSELANYLIDLMKKALLLNIQDSWTGFQSFLGEYQEDMENQGTAITVLQFVYNLRLLMPNFKELTEDITEEIVGIFNDSFAGEQSEFDENRKYIAATYYLALLAPPYSLIPEASLPEILEQLFVAAFGFVGSECVPKDLTDFILAYPLKDFVRKYTKKLVIQPETILSLLQGDYNILTIMGTLTNAIDNENLQAKYELINQVVSNMAELINSDRGQQRIQFFNLSYFFLPFGRHIMEPSLCQTIVEFIHGIIPNFQYDDGIIGNYLAISWIFGDVGFALFNEIAEFARQPNALNGFCRSLLWFVKTGESTQCPFEYKQIVTQPEWQAEKFAFIFERVVQVYNDFINQNYNFKDTSAYCAMFSSFFRCMLTLHRYISNEQYQAFFEFTADYLSKMSCFPAFLSNVYEFFNTLAANKLMREGFDPLALLEPMHSFLFSPKFNVHMSNPQIPKYYPNLLTNLSKLHYQAFSECMKSILVQFQMSDEFSSEYLKQFEGNEASGQLANLLEQIIRRRTFALHQ